MGLGRGDPARDRTGRCVRRKSTVRSASRRSVSRRMTRRNHVSAANRRLVRRRALATRRDRTPARRRARVAVDRGLRRSAASTTGYAIGGVDRPQRDVGDRVRHRACAAWTARDRDGRVRSCTARRAALDARRAGGDRAAPFRDRRSGVVARAFERRATNGDRARVLAQARPRPAAPRRRVDRAHSVSRGTRRCG